MLIPDNIDSSSSRGERLVFNHFRTDINSKEFIILHSLFIASHLKRISGELDFLVIAPNRGIFALEVKHGKVTRKGGVWIFENRHGAKNKSSIGPFNQVNDTMHSLRSYLLEITRDNEKLNKRIQQIVFGCGVMFTGLEEFHEYGTEAEAWQIFTRLGFRAPASHYIDSLSKGFHNKYKDKSWYDKKLSRPSYEECGIIHRLLRGDFNHDYSNINRVLDGEKIIEGFTKEQFEILSLLQYNDRCLIRGGAGTGKTLMAMEWYMKLAETDFNVGLFCFNRMLGERIKDDLSVIAKGHHSNNYIGNLHSYMRSISHLNPPKTDDSHYWEEELPFDCLIQLEDSEESEKFDFLIIDEAQDMLRESYLFVFDAILKGGIASGKWAMFGDFTNQLIYETNPDKMLDLLSSKSAYTKAPPLRINCRNTKRITRHKTRVTGCEAQESPVGMLVGDYIEHHFTLKNRIDQKIEEIISNLLTGGIPIEKITVLSAKRISNSEILNSTLGNTWKKKGLLHTTIQSFKGLENSFIILTDFSELESDYAISLLYIGISRARLKLFIVMDKSLEKDYNRLLEAGLKKIME